MKRIALIPAVGLTLLVAGCGQSENKGPQVVAAGDVVATVNGKAISKASFEILAQEVNERRGENKVPDDKIIDELIKRELLGQELLTADMAKDPQLAAKLENAERMMLSQAAAEEFIENAQVTEEDLKKEYDERVGAAGNSEFRARHILVETEAAAKDVIEKLGKGEKFEALAKKFSKDPGSKDKGGELGWFSPQQMVQPFSDAVATLKNGEVTKTPVQSQFGWHVIQREESREQPVPPFEAVKDQLRGMVQTRKLQDHLAKLQEKAKIEKKLPEAPKKEAEAPTAAPAVPAVPATLPAVPKDAPAVPKTKP